MVDARWTTVIDNLPRDFGPYLVHRSVLGYSVETYYGSGLWELDGLKGCGDVTHWMPLPEPPKVV